MAAALKEKGYAYLGWLLDLQVHHRTSLLVVAVRYFFRRQVEEDAELARGLTFDELKGLSQTQAEGFRNLHDTLKTHGEQLERMLGNLREAITDIGRDIQRVRQVQEQVLEILKKRQMNDRPVRPEDSRTIQTDEERKEVQELVRIYRNLPANLRAQAPALLNDLGKIKIAMGDFEGARQDFREAATLPSEPPAQAEAHHNAYWAALQGDQLDEALHELRQALALDPARFAPFPLEQYEPQRILGAGGFGVTFLCHDQLMKGQVAVKSLIAGGGCDPSTVFQEAGALDQLHHPAIIPLRGRGYADAGRTRPYLVMEYFPGQTLERYVKDNGPVPLGEFKSLARRIAEALQAAHGKGILHRDVKPANVLVRRAGEDWEIRLIDFGLAVRQQVLDTASTVRNAGITGTLDYAAPEQLGRVPGARIGPAADVYGFARTCCSALFGTPAPLPQDWKKVPPALAGLLGECLVQSPVDRLGDFAQVLERLKRIRAPRGARRPASGDPEPEVEELPAPQPRLLVLRGLQRNIEYALREGQNLIGRADEQPVDIDLSEQEPEGRIWSSRRHALITRQAGQVLIEDLNSANGTYVNRTRVYPGTKRPLNLNDIIQIGNVQLKVIA
jgi:serine/threonine protein kinase